jgi:lipopolysaccharide export system permease protein
MDSQTEKDSSGKKARSHVGLLTRPWWKLSMGIWDYITREATTPFVMALSVIMLVFLLQFLMRFIDRIVGKGLDLWTIVQLIVFNLAWMVVLAVPMAVLVAGVMAFGSLASSNEMTAMKAAGVSLGRMMFPVIVLSTLVAIFDLQFNNIILPDANHRAKDLMSDIQRKKPALIVEPGQFTTDNEIPGYSILARRTNPATNDLEDVTIYDHTQPSQSQVFTAKFAHLSFTSDFRNIILTMRDGEVHQENLQQPSDYRRGHFGEYIVQVPTNGYDFMHQGESERSGRELSVEDLLKYVHTRDALKTRQVATMSEHLKSFAMQLTSPVAPPLPPNPATVTHPASLETTLSSPKRSRLLKEFPVKPTLPMKGLLPAQTPPKPVQPPVSPAPISIPSAMRTEFSPHLMVLQNDAGMIEQTQSDIDSYTVEVHKKYAIPASCIIFAIIGVPLGALAKRSGVGAGAGLSIGFFVLYWIFLIGGEKLADRAVITPFWGMWGGNLILLLIGIYLTWRVASEAPQMRSIKWIKEFWSTYIRRKNVAVQ